MQGEHRKECGRDRDGGALDYQTGGRGPGRVEADAGQTCAEGEAGALAGAGDLEPHRREDLRQRGGVGEGPNQVGGEEGQADDRVADSNQTRATVWRG